MSSVFISYARKNQSKAVKFVDRLEAHGLSVWIDKSSISGASYWSEEIVKAIDGSQVVIVFLTPQSVSSPNVVKEVHLAMEKMKPLLPIYLEPTKIPSSLQYHLAGIQHIECYEDNDVLSFQAVLDVLTSLGIGVGLKPVESRRSSQSTESALSRLGGSRIVFPRKRLLDESHRLLDASTAPIVLLQGLAGVGKTTLLCEVARSRASVHSQILAMRFVGPAALEPGYFLEELNGFLQSQNHGIDPQKIWTQKPEKIIRLLMEQLEDFKVLVLLDGTEALPPDWLETIVENFSRLPQVKVLTTARKRILQSLQAHVVTVPPLSPDESVAFALTYVEKTGIQIDIPALLSQLPEGVRSHPQALSTLLVQLKDFPIELLLFAGVPEVAREAAQLIEQVIRSLNTIEKRVLAFVALLAQQELYRVIQHLEVPQPVEFLDAFRSLIDRSLVHRTGVTYVVPSVVCDAMVAVEPSLIPSIANPIVSAWIAKTLSNNATTDEFAFHAGIGAQITHFLAEQKQWELVSDLTKEGALEQLNILGCWKEYSLMLRCGIEAARQQHQPTTQLMLACRLARKLNHMGDCAGAHAALSEAESILEKAGVTLGHAELHSHRALLLDSEGKDGEALQELILSRNVREQIGDTHGLVVVEKLIGNIYLRRRDYGNARQQYVRSLEYLEKSPNEKNWIEVESSLALCDLHDEALGKAEDRLREVKKRCVKIRYDTGLARASLSLASVLEQNGQIYEAYQEALNAVKLAESTYKALAVGASMIAARLAERLGIKHND